MSYVMILDPPKPHGLPSLPAPTLPRPPALTEPTEQSGPNGTGYGSATVPNFISLCRVPSTSFYLKELPKGAEGLSGTARVPRGGWGPRWVCN